MSILHDHLHIRILLLSVTDETSVRTLENFNMQIPRNGDCLVFDTRVNCIHKPITMRRKKLPYLLRLIRFTIKCVWFALTTPNDPYHEKEVNFWNIPIRKRQRQYR